MPEAKRSWPKLSLLVSALLWLLAGALIVFLPNHPRVVIRTNQDYLMGFSPDGNTLITSVLQERDFPGCIYQLWDTRSGKNLGTLGHEDRKILPNMVYCSQRNLVLDGYLPFGSSDSFSLYDLTAKRETFHRGECLSEPATTLCFSPDGSILACCIYSYNHRNGALMLIDVATGQIRADLKGAKGGHYEGLVFSQDGSTLAMMETQLNLNPGHPIPDEEKVDPKIIVLETATGRILQTFRDVGAILSLSPNGTQLAVGSVLNPRDGLHGGIWLVAHPGMEIGIESRQVKLWDVATGKQISSFEGEFLDFSWTGEGFALVEENGFSLCHAISGRKYADIKASPYFLDSFLRNDPISSSLLPIPKKDFLAVFSDYSSRYNFFFLWFSYFLGNKGLNENDNEMTFFDARTGEELASIAVVGPQGVKVSPDGKSLAMFSLENNDHIEIWDIPPRKPLHWVLGLLAIPSMVTMFTLWKWRKKRLRTLH